jgi:hypothetical protein
MVEDANASFIKVRLCNQGEDSETPWAEDLGPARGPEGSRMVRLVNVPFLHAKPTWGDVIIVSPVDDGLLTWDSKNVAWSKIDTRIEEDGGRFAMIVDYTPHDGGTGDAEFSALHTACTEHDVVCEGAWAPRADRAGRAYLAVPDALAPGAVMEHLVVAGIPAALHQIHPKPDADGAQRAVAKPSSRSRAAGGGKSAASNRAPKSAAKSQTRAAKPAGKAAAKTAGKAAAKTAGKAAAKRAAKTGGKRAATPAGKGAAKTAGKRPATPAMKRRAKPAGKRATPAKRKR